MTRRRFRSAAIALLVFVFPVAAEENQPMTYPQTRHTDTAEVHFGVTVRDPFRWLENDPRQDAEVARWIEAQNALSAPYLESFPGRDVFERRLRAMFDQEPRLRRSSAMADTSSLSKGASTIRSSSSCGSAPTVRTAS